jgi:hypothetical protein
MTQILTGYRVDAIPAAQLDRIRRTGADEAGNAFAPFTADEPGAPLRCCLREARAGERIALIAFRPAGGTGPYAEIGPVFVHADECPGYADPQALPIEFRHRRQVLRSYNCAGRIEDAVLVDGEAAEDGLAELFANPDVTVVHARNVLFGCYLYAIRPA